MRQRQDGSELWSVVVAVDLIIENWQDQDQTKEALEQNSGFI
jgi:hypothetical protein